MNYTLDFLGLLSGLVFVYLNIKAGKSMTGSFFKNSYHAFVVASVFFTLSWASNFLGILSISSAATAEFLHHAFMFVSGLVFVITSYNLPKDAAKYMDKNQ